MTFMFISISTINMTWLLTLHYTQVYFTITFYTPSSVYEISQVTDHLLYFPDYEGPSRDCCLPAAQLTDDTLTRPVSSTLPLCRM